MKTIVKLNDFFVISLTYDKDGDEVLYENRKYAVIHASVEKRKFGPRFVTVGNFVLEIQRRNVNVVVR